MPIANMEQNEKGKGEIKEAETGAGRGLEESPETLEPREKRTKAEAAPPGHLPSLGNLKNLLEETNKAVAVTKMTNQEIDELVTKHQETERRLRQAEQLRKKRIARVESFDPLRKAEPSDYDLLLREGIIIDDFAKLHGAESPKIAKETL